AVNADREPAPSGVGFHPYLTLGTASVDGLTLTVPATTYLQPDSRAAGRFMVPVTATPQDFTRPRQIGSTQLDAAFGSLVRGDAGRAVARLHDLDSDRSLHLWVDDSYRYLMVYTADHVARPERRRAAVAIEPMTCPPDAFRTGADLIELEPGESWQGTWGLGSDQS
ncbi:MAG TPA: aldose epimerase, partial [Propionibacteriaceae bacterium]|nr:aldose epimerase [Propionibacteriaceae bacterium]